jgi:hypothetical protein
MMVMSGCFEKVCICPRCGKPIDPYYNILRDGIKTCMGCEESRKDAGI